jgi:CheY-like chemotaxis protein
MNSLEGDMEKCIEGGMDDYIAKPVKKDDLAALLRDIAPHIGIIVKQAGRRGADRQK